MNEEKSTCRCSALLDSCVAMIASLRRPGARGLRDINSQEAIRDDVQRRLDSLRAAVSAAGLTRSVDAMLHPIVALADEVAQAHHDELATLWANRTLQMHYFDENVGGELFFSRLEAALSERGTSPLVLRAYFLCLCLGFRGRYAIDGDPMELDRTRESLRDELEQRGLLQAGEQLSPHAERPAMLTAAPRGGRRAAWMALGGASLVLASILAAQVIDYYMEVERLVANLRDAISLSGVVS